MAIQIFFLRPLRSTFFFDEPEPIIGILCSMWSELFAMSNTISRNVIRDRLTSDSLISPAGYTGFRWATQLDQTWNAYLLGLVIQIAGDIERRRDAAGGVNVFSYRFDPSSAESLFRADIGWRQFQEESVRRAKAPDCRYVVSCDIADFYSRIYHHTLENELERCGADGTVVSQIMSILSAWSGSVSYGLPVGGDAARVLAELAIVPVDSILVANSISFCRFVDDYRLFARSREEAHAAWVSLSQHLLQLNGLQLQKYKTVVESSFEYSQRVERQIKGSPASPGEDKEELSFLSIKIHYDPYSDTASADYDHLREQILKHDILGMGTPEQPRACIG